MKISLNLGKIITSLIAIAVTASASFAVGALIEFNHVKKKVNDLDEEIAKHKNKIDFIAVVSCKILKSVNPKEAPETCLKLGENGSSINR